MSAHPWYDVRISCNGVINGRPCLSEAWGSHLDVSDPITAARTRRILRARGWSQGRKGRGGPTQDYCPKQHDPDSPQPVRLRS